MATTDKYDRQLRLWGANGQRALCSTHIILVNATACGTETLKNLVLPGIGSFLILDDQILPAPSISGTAKITPFSNFFAPVTKENTGKHRCAVACDLLLEMNEDVSGAYQHVSSLSDVQFEDLFKNHDSLLVIAADLSLPILRPLSHLCELRNIPLINVKSYGLIGTVRLQCPYHPIVESKPDNSPPDLRLANFDPLFEPLKKLVDEVDMSKLSDFDHRHTPYVIILVKALEKWRQTTTSTSRFPASMQDKTEFKNTVKHMSRNYGEELNFQEAYQDAYLAYARRDLPEDVSNLLEKPPSIDTSFGVLLQSLKKIIDENNEPPLNGSIPDMTSSTDLYIRLQKAYHQKATEDLAKMTKYVQASSQSVPVSEEEISLFCKNVYNIRLLSTRSISKEIENQTKTFSEEIRDDLLMHCMDPAEPDEHTPLLWYIVLRACELHHEEFGIYPGADSRKLSLQSDISAVHTRLVDIIKTMGLEGDDLVRRTLVESTNHVEEMVRYYNAEVHNVASVVGGVASQEAVKLITKQYVPLDNTYVFNGIAGIGGVYRL